MRDSSWLAFSHPLNELAYASVATTTTTTFVMVVGLCGGDGDDIGRGLGNLNWRSHYPAVTLNRNTLAIQAHTFIYITLTKVY